MRFTKLLIMPVGISSSPISNDDTSKSFPMKEFNSEFPEAICIDTVKSVHPVIISVPLQYTRLSATNTACLLVFSSEIEFNLFRCAYKSALIELLS